MICWYIPVLFLSTTVLGRQHVNLALITPTESDMFSLQHVMPVIGQVTSGIRNFQFSVRYGDSKCNIKDGPIQAIEFYMNDEADVFMGPLCDYSLAPVARYAPYWNIPVVTSGGFAHEFGENKLEYPTLTRVGATSNSFALAMIDTLRIFHWNKVKVIYDASGQGNIIPKLCFHTASALATSARRSGIEMDFHKLTPHMSNFEDMLKDEIGTSESIVVLCANPDSVRDIMIKAHQLNFDNGEYVFFNIDIFSSKDAIERPWFRPNDTEERNNMARQAYESVMTITLKKPNSPEYHAFSAEVKRRAMRMYSNFTYGEEEVNSFVGAFHDAVLLYTLALTDTLRADGTVSDGAAITRNMWNRTFTGITGTVSIDANGDRTSDYSLLDMDPGSNTFQVVANHYGNTRQYVPVVGRRVHWPGGRNEAPPDTPTCGYDGSKCQGQGQGQGQENV